MCLQSGLSVLAKRPHQVEVTRHSEPRVNAYLYKSTSYVFAHRLRHVASSKGKKLGSEGSGAVALDKSEIGQRCSKDAVLSELVTAEFDSQPYLASEPYLTKGYIRHKKVLNHELQPMTSTPVSTNAAWGLALCYHGRGLMLSVPFALRIRYTDLLQKDVMSSEANSKIKAFHNLFMKLQHGSHQKREATLTNGTRRCGGVYL